MEYTSDLDQLLHDIQALCEKIINEDIPLEDILLVELTDISAVSILNNIISSVQQCNQSLLHLNNYLLRSVEELSQIQDTELDIKMREFHKTEDIS